MKKLLAITLLSLSSASAPAFADNYLSVDAGPVAMNTTWGAKSPQVIGFTAGHRLVGNDDGVQIYAEGSYVNIDAVVLSQTIGATTVSPTPIPTVSVQVSKVTRVSQYAVRAAATAVLPITDAFDVLGTAGLAMNHAAYESPTTASSSDIKSLMYGIGARYRVAGNFAFVGKYENMGKVDVLPGAPSSDNTRMSAGMQIIF